MIISWQQFLASKSKFAPIAATVGVFDGVHSGHRALISRVVSRTPEAHPCVLTFETNPKSILYPRTFHGDLYSLPKKLQLLESEGVELCILIDFSAEFGTLSGGTFLTSLREFGRMTYIAVGSDFRCGYRLDTDASALVQMSASMGIEAEILGPVLWNEWPVSSSRIRRAILEGRVEEAMAMLGRPYSVETGNNPCTRLEDGHWSIAAPDVPIHPPDGMYRVMAVTKSGRESSSLEVRQGIWIGHSEAIPSEIEFLESVSRVD